MNKQVVSKKLPTVGQGQAPVGTGTGRAGSKPTSEMVALPDESPGHDRPEATPRPLETSSGPAGTQGAADAAEEQPAQENSAAKAAGSSESAPQAESPGVASGTEPLRKKVKSTKEPKATPRKGKEEVKEPTESSRAPHSSRPPHRRRSAPTRTPRATSEPPQTAQSRGALSDGAVARTPRSLGDPRLPKLLTDIESHFRRVERKLPLDASGWLRETAQLELFEEELQWILQQHEPPPEEATPDASPDASPTDAPKFVDGGKAPGGEATEAGEASPSATEGVDLETALLHLRHCEREHAYLQQMLGYDDVIFREERLAEIKQVEEEIDYEQRRVRHMETEHRKRERNLARVAARAISMSVNDGDGNLRAMRHAEQFESESAVWQVKNESMQKQALQLNIYLKQDIEKLEQLNSKLAALREKLETDEAKQWIEEQRLREEERWNEEQALGAEVRALQDRRTFEEQACKRSHIAQLKQLADLRKKRNWSPQRSSSGDSSSSAGGSAATRAAPRTAQMRLMRHPQTAQRQMARFRGSQKPQRQRMRAVPPPLCAPWQSRSHSMRSSSRHSSNRLKGRRQRILEQLRMKPRKRKRQRAQRPHKTSKVQPPTRRRLPRPWPSTCFQTKQILQVWHLLQRSKVAM